MGLTRTEILKGNWIYPSELVRLVRTKHFMERLEERGIGVDCIPTVIRVTRNNIYCAQTEGGKELTTVVVRLDYNSHRYVFLAFNPFNGVLKTLWFKEKRRPNGSRPGPTDNEDSGQTVRDSGDKDEVSGHT